jgi:uncharacterized protein
VDTGNDCAQFLSDFLARPVRMVRFDPEQPRFSNPDYTAGREVRTLFSDGYPLLVLSMGSVRDLSARVGRTLVVERFRPNLVLDGVDAYAEDQAHTLKVGSVEITLTKPCTRCVITTLDPKTGERGDEEPLATLKKYRFDPALHGVTFGRNAYALAGRGQKLVKGDPVTLQ